MNYYNNQQSENRLIDHEWSQRLSEELNHQQCCFVTLEHQHIMGIAGPGSGKTRALVFRAAHLIKSGVPPHRILLVTFTNKASEEMKERLNQILGYQLDGMWAGTFHSVGARILRRHASFWNRGSSFSILDDEDRASLWKELINNYKETLSEEELNLFLKRRIADRIVSQANNSGLDLEEVIKEYYPSLEEYCYWLKELNQKYEERKRIMNAFDFDDLLVKWCELFEKAPEIGDNYLLKFQHVLVDEFQDTNVIQGRLVDWFARGTSVCLVGDDAQSIYGFRFAEVGNMLRFPERFPSCKVIKLEQNYRSHPEIVELANRIISYNTQQLPKELFSRKPSGEEPVIAKVRDGYEEAHFVLERINDLLEKGVLPSEISVLYRSSYLASEVEFELLKRKISYRTYGGLKFVQKAHIRDVLAWLKVLYNPKDVVAWRRLISMQKGLGPTTCEKIITSLIKSSDPLNDILEGKVKPSRGKDGWEVVCSTINRLKAAETAYQMIHVVLEEGYHDLLVKNYPDNWEERFRGIEQLAHYGNRYQSLDSFLESLSLEESLIWDNTKEIQEKNFITLSTIHSAKGKEWEAVFILALNHGIFPGKMASDLEEERRLFYVAATRARRYLFLLTREKDFRWGAPVVTGPSLFLQELGVDFDNNILYEME